MIMIACIESYGLSVPERILGGRLYHNPKPAVLVMRAGPTMVRLPYHDHYQTSTIHSERVPVLNGDVFEILGSNSTTKRHRPQLKGFRLQGTRGYHFRIFSLM